MKRILWRVAFCLFFASIVMPAECNQNQNYFPNQWGNFGASFDMEKTGFLADGTMCKDLAIKSLKAGLNQIRNLEYAKQYLSDTAEKLSRIRVQYPDCLVQSEKLLNYTLSFGRILWYDVKNEINRRCADAALTFRSGLDCQPG